MIKMWEKIGVSAEYSAMAATRAHNKLPGDSGLTTARLFIVSSNELPLTKAPGEAHSKYCGWEFGRSYME
jgi:hypothetical protein